jgi:hypothetical protein
MEHESSLPCSQDYTSSPFAKLTVAQLHRVQTSLATGSYPEQD